jgi:hypothetical protein
MPATQSSTTYSLSCGTGWSTPAGTQVGGAIQLDITAGSDFTDADLFALQQALVTALPASWNVTLTDFSAMKLGQEFTTYVTNATATPPSFT